MDNNKEEFMKSAVPGDTLPEAYQKNGDSGGRAGRTQIRCPVCGGGTWKEENEYGWLIYCTKCGKIVETYTKPWPSEE